MSSPTQRSLKYLRDRGWVARKIEQRLPFPRNVTRDVFGGDILAVHPQLKITAVIQATSASNHNARVKKCLGLLWEEGKEDARDAIVLEIIAWLETGNQFQVHSWGKKGAKGKRKYWELCAEELTLKHFRALRSVKRGI